MPLLGAYFFVIPGWFHRTKPGTYEHRPFPSWRRPVFLLGWTAPTASTVPDCGLSQPQPREAVR